MYDIGLFYIIIKSVRFCNQFNIKLLNLTHYSKLILGSDFEKTNHSSFLIATQKKNSIVNVIIIG